MWMGRYQVGGSVPLRLRCKTDAGVPTFPDNPPMVHVFDGSNTLLLAKQMPVEERYIGTGRFNYPLFLGSGYTAGHYTVVYYFALSSVMKAMQDTFEVIPNGSTSGAVTAAYFYERPEANYVLQGSEDGSLTKRRGPSVN